FPAGVCLLPGAREAVASVGKHGAVAAVVSSTARATIELTLEHYGLSRLVTFVVGGGESSPGKPAPRASQRAPQEAPTLPRARQPSTPSFQIGSEGRVSGRRRLIGRRHCGPLGRAPRVPHSTVSTRRARNARIHTRIIERVSNAGRTSRRRLSHV